MFKNRLAWSQFPWNKVLLLWVLCFYPPTFFLHCFLWFIFITLKAKYSKKEYTLLCHFYPYLSLNLILIGKYVWQWTCAFSLRKDTSFESVILLQIIANGKEFGGQKMFVLALSLNFIFLFCIFRTHTVIFKQNNICQNFIT